VEAPKKVFETPWFSIDAIPQENQTPYYRLSCNDSIVIVPKTADGRLVLIRQFRPAIGKHMLEWPAGQVDDGETPARAAERELLEETGYTCDSIEFFRPLSRVALPDQQQRAPVLRPRGQTLPRAPRH
jgi:8-oxo-dGTP pyrophosphatase MutT (NUDIX family)